jgi:hypothetical protein
MGDNWMVTFASADKNTQGTVEAAIDYVWELNHLSSNLLPNILTVIL